MQLSSELKHQIKHNIESQNSDIGVVSLPFNEKLVCLTFAASLNIAPLVYFAMPQQEVEYLSIDAWQVLDNKSAQQLVTSASGVRCFGINAFDCGSDEFKSEYWVLPKIWFEKREHNWRINIVSDCTSRSSNDVWQEIEVLLDQLEETHEVMDAKYYGHVVHSPSKDDWIQSVESVKQKMSMGEIHKVVLARQSLFTFDEALNPFTLLKKVQDSDNGVYNFCIKINNNTAFIGGTPERLYEIKGNVIESDAIAGTIFKPDDANVSKLKKELLTSDKNIGEHQYVVDFIKDSFETLCSNVNIDSNRSLIELRYLMHLIIHFEGKLRRGVDWLTALKVLHPTPAVAGVPSDQAMSTIKEREPFNRNWYAGPMGTIAKNDANIVVAIRSGTVINNQVLLSAGAGIVLESDPNDEWDELDAKINLFATIFSKDAV